jgi:hypothetical protein
MRWGRRVAVVVLTVSAVAACGGGDSKSNTAATGSGSPGSQLSAGSDGASSAGSTAADPSAAPGSDASGADSAGAPGAAPSGDAGAAPAGDGNAPAPSGLKPFAGTYQFHTTGHATLNGGQQNIDTQSPSTVEDLNDTDQRTSASGAQGEQNQVLRYSADKVELVSFELKGAVNKTFNGPVLLSPVPLSVGQTWDWSMQSTDTDPTKKKTLTQTSRVDRAETVVVNGQSVDVLVIETDVSFSSPATDLNGRGHLTNWVSPVYRMPVKTHSTLAGTYAAFTFDADTTSDLLDLRPS